MDQNPPCDGHHDEHQRGWSSSAKISPSTTESQEGKKRSKQRTKSAAAKDPTCKRTTRACDQCNRLRTKCDGQNPCAHCVEAKLTCEYLRVPQKRGKASEAYTSKKAAQAVQSGVQSSTTSVQQQQQRQQSSNRELSDSLLSLMSQVPPMNHVPGDGQMGGGRNSTIALSNSNNSHDLGSLSHYSLYPSIVPSSSQGHLNDQLRALDRFDTAPQHNTGSGQFPARGGTVSSPLQQQPQRHKLSLTPSPFAPFQSPSDMFNSQSPSWFGNSDHRTTSASPPLIAPTRQSVHSISTGQRTDDPTPPNLLYRPSLSGPVPPGSGPPIYHDVISPSVASSGSNTTPNYNNGHIIHPEVKGTRQGSNASAGSVTRLHDLHQLGRSALQANVEFSTRYPVLNTVLPLLDKVPLSLVEDLLESYFSHSTHVLTYLVRGSSVLRKNNPRKLSKALLLAMLMVAAHNSDNPTLSTTPSSRNTIISKLSNLTMQHLLPINDINASGTLDDLITYIQIATIVSASENKGSSLKWWGDAFNLAKKLRLNQENANLDPERREEERRTWWLLYIVDRHLGLCYNRPLAILDSECSQLYRPGDEDIWQSDMELAPPELDPDRMRGICYIVTGQGIYGYFLPLMTILGTLVEIHHLEQNPLIPLQSACQQMKSSVVQFLDQYMMSLKNWNPTPCQHAYENAWRDYAFELANVFHVLHLVSWDPIELLQSPVTNIASPDFQKATNHAIAAAKSMRKILSVDADLRLMPFFLGIYLLQGSFILLALVDRVESEASQEVFAACETIVHAHEVCIVTLNTEYQRNFRRVMRDTMSLLTSSASPTDPMNGITKDEARRRQQDVLGLYRWTPGGHGLAV